MVEHKHQIWSGLICNSFFKAVGSGVLTFRTPFASSICFQRGTCSMDEGEFVFWSRVFMAGVQRLIVNAQNKKSAQNCLVHFQRLYVVSGSLLS